MKGFPPERGDWPLDGQFMPSMKINGTPVDFEPGATILDAARGAGIDIPTLCWYPKLTTVANCRICLVSVDGQGKLTPACYTQAAEDVRADRIA
jgi:NADH dehydrogenase/NADH:ubiquinone oxidoreductase subunit G